MRQNPSLEHRKRDFLQHSLLLAFPIQMRYTNTTLFEGDSPMHDTAPRGRRRRRSACITVVIIALILILVLLLTAFLLRPTLERTWMEHRFPLEYESLIFYYSSLHDLDPFLVMGVIRAESSFRSHVTSPVGASGLMQIMPTTGEWLAERMGISFEIDDLFNPAYNIRMGTYYLRLLIGMFGYLDTALAAYNAGMGNVSNWLDDTRYSADGATLHTIPFAETREYVERVNRYTEIYRELYS